MKITFITPAYHNQWEALGVGYLMAVCKLYGVNCDFYQGGFDSDETIVEGCKNSDIVCFSCTSPTFAHGLRLSRAIGKRSVFGGWHVTALREKALIDGVDQVVIGEGEWAILDIITGRRNKVIQGMRMVDRPWPDRAGIKNHRTVDLCEKMTGRRSTGFQATRGCPFKCVFCAEHIMSHHEIHKRKVKGLLAEIEAVSQIYKLDMFKFVDATFDADPEYVISFCKEKIRQDNKLPWECMIHAQTATMKMFYWLKEANCEQVNIGVESGSPDVLRSMCKGVTLQKIEKAFKWAKEKALRRRAFFLVGMPIETGGDIELTKQFIQKIKPDSFGVTLLCPYPGSALYNHETMKGIDWEATDEYGNDFWETPNASNYKLKARQRYLTEGCTNLAIRQNESSLRTST